MEYLKYTIGGAFENKASYMVQWEIFPWQCLKFDLRGYYGTSDVKR